MENEPIDVFAPKKEATTVVGSALQKFSLPKDMAVALKERFEPFEKQAKEWEAKAMALVVMDESQKDLMAEARKARLALRQIRLDVGKLHEREKADALRTTQLLDTIKRTLTGYIEPLEAHLQAQEDFAKVQAEKRKMEALTVRMEALKPYRVPGDRLELVPFGEMDQGAFDTFLMGLKASKELREQQAKEIERVRLENEQKARDERERIKKENIRRGALNLAGFSWDGNHYFVGDFKRLDMATIIGLSDDDFDDTIKAGAAEVKRLAVIEQQKKDELAAKLKEETEAREKLEKENRERLAKEEKERKDKATAERKLKRAPDKIKLLNLAERIELIEPIQVKDDVAKAIYTNAVERLAQLVKDIKLQCEQL